MDKSVLENDQPEGQYENPRENEGSIPDFLCGEIGEMNLDFQVGSRKRERPKVVLAPRRKLGKTKQSGHKGKAGGKSRGQKKKERGSLSSTGSSERETKEEIEKWYRIITEKAKTDPPKYGDYIDYDAWKQELWDWSQRNNHICGSTKIVILMNQYQNDYTRDGRVMKNWMEKAWNILDEDDWHQDLSICDFIVILNDVYDEQCMKDAESRYLRLNKRVSQLTTLAVDTTRRFVDQLKETGLHQKWVIYKECLNGYHSDVLIAFNEFHGKRRKKRKETRRKRTSSKRENQIAD